MRGSIRQLAGRISEGAYCRALKAEAEVIEGNLSDLLWDLLLYRYAMQRVVDALWDLDKVPSRSQAHRMFYQMLRGYGFRAHVARNIYEYALALIKAVKESDGGKPTLRRFSARLDYQDARVELVKGVVRIILRDKWYTLRLRHRREYIERFRSLRWKEVHIKYVNGRLFVSIVFEFMYRPYVPRGIIALDVNLRMVTAYDGSKVRRYKTRFVDALNKRRRAEDLQKRYPKRWRYSKKILSRVKVHHRKAKNIATDWCWKLAKQAVLKALKKSCAIALEGLEGLRERVNNKGDEVVWKFTIFAYRRLQHSIISKAIEYGVPVVVVDPRSTSSTCPRCGEKLTYIHRLATCRMCGFKADRDSVGAMNIWFRALQAYAGVPGSPLSAPAVKGEAGRSGGTKHEGMKKIIRAIHS
jgi:putative transposase